MRQYLIRQKKNQTSLVNRFEFTRLSKFGQLAASLDNVTSVTRIHSSKSIRVNSLQPCTAMRMNDYYKNTQKF